MDTELDYSIAYRRALTDAAILGIGVIRTTADGESKYIPPGSMIAEPTFNTWSRLKAGTIRIWNSIASMLAAATNQGTCASSLINSIRAIVGRSGRCSLESKNSSRRIPVFDLAYCGPRNCFTVLSNRGPLLVHNCGYAGGVGAFLTFSLAYGIDLDAMADKVLPAAPGDVIHEAEGFYDWTLKKDRPTFGISRQAFIASDVVKRLWRGAHPGVVSLWADLEAACKTAVSNPGETFPVRRFKVRRDGAWLRVGLPSGRCLCYPSPKCEDGQLSYMGMNQYTRQWQRIKTHGGKLVENAAQSLARDVMFDNLPRIEAAGYEIVLRVHDEVVTEAPLDPFEFNEGRLSSLLATPHDWCLDMPLAAAGFSSQRYRK